MRERLGRLSPKQFLRRHRPLVITREYEAPPGVAWDDSSYKRDAYGTYGWACDVVEVELNRETWHVVPTRFLTVHEIGRAIHPILARGEIEGGSADALRMLRNEGPLVAMAGCTDLYVALNFGTLRDT